MHSLLMSRPRRVTVAKRPRAGPVEASLSAAQAGRPTSRVPVPQCDPGHISYGVAGPGFGVSRQTSHGQVNRGPDSEQARASRLQVECGGPAARLLLKRHEQVMYGPEQARFGRVRPREGQGESTSESQSFQTFSHFLKCSEARTQFTGITQLVCNCNFDQGYGRA